MFMAKSETIVRVASDFGCPCDDLFNLAPENSILYSVIYFSYSGIVSNCFSETKKLTVWHNLGVILVLAR